MTFESRLSPPTQPPAYPPTHSVRQGDSLRSCPTLGGPAPSAPSCGSKQSHQGPAPRSPCGTWRPEVPAGDASFLCTKSGPRICWNARVVGEGPCMWKPATALFSSASYEVDHLPCTKPPSRGPLRSRTLRGWAAHQTGHPKWPYAESLGIQ